MKGKLITPSGEVFHDQRPADKPLPPGDPGVRVKFTSLDVSSEKGQPSQSYIARIEPDSGTFEVPGPKGEGIPAGKYRVTVYLGAIGETPTVAQRPSTPTVENATEDDPGLDGREVTRIEVTVPPEGLSELTITISPKKK